MSRPFALLALSLLAVTASAAAQPDEGKKENLAVLAALAACDKGAASPLDPTATEPPVQFSELFGDTFDITALRAAADACRLAADARPDVPRYRLQSLRTDIALGERFDPAMVQEVMRLAEEGGPEANYLVYAFFRVNDQTGIDLATAQSALRAAAAAGHREALEVMMGHLQSGPHFRRDQREAARYAALLAELPSQGIGFPNAMDRESMAYGSFVASALPLLEADFPADEQARAFGAIRGLFEGGEERARVAYATALRHGRGTEADPVQARALLEDGMVRGNPWALVSLAEMLADGEGGPADGRRAIALLTGQLAQQASYAARPVLAGLYLDNRYTGPRPREALRLLATTSEIDPRIRAVALFLDYDEKLDYPASYKATMDAATAVGEPGAGLAWARLKLSGHPQFGGDVTGARAILETLAASGDREAELMFAETQYVGLDEGRFNPPRREGGMTDAEIRTVVEAGIADERADAFRVMAKLLRVGAVYPQDDAAATRALLDAAERGDVESMVLLGKAYDDGLGIPKSPRERLRWWREAARLGSLAATERLVDAFSFDTFDKLMTLREGITARVALYNNGPDPDSVFGGMAVSGFSGMFVGGRPMEAGYAALTAAVMDGFRLAPAGLDDRKLVPLARALPDEIRIGIETVLQREGFYAGAPEGYFGPEVRAALAAWVDARGPLPDEAASEGGGGPAGGGEAVAGALPAELVDRIRDRVFTEVNGGNLSEEDQVRLIGELNALARYGDLSSRWALLQNYHLSGLVQRIVAVADIARYGLDLVVTRPEQAEKVDFEFIFVLSAIYQNGGSGDFGKAYLDAVRDDARLQDPLTLGGVAQQAMFAPGACDGILEAATQAAIAGIGADGCDEATQAAIIAYAREAGPAGADAAARAAAAEVLRGMDVAAQ